MSIVSFPFEHISCHRQTRPSRVFRNVLCIRLVVSQRARGRLQISITPQHNRSSSPTSPFKLPILGESTMTDPPVYNLDDSDDASTMVCPTLPLPKHYTHINNLIQTMVSDSSGNNIEPFAATFDDPSVELNELLTDALDRRQEMLENLSRIKKDLLEINRNDKANTTQVSTPSPCQVKRSSNLMHSYNSQRASTMREFREGCDKAAELIADMKGWVKRQAEWRREEQDKRWLEEIVVFERAMIMQKRIMELIIEEAEKEARAGRYSFGLGVWGMQKEGFGFV